ncbi:MAG TPA: hypothetical protein VFO31_20955 [Vicinamibacterales bacterium]|nr:hypothetical protein [Vicinamibacterales bacterium]
MPLILAIEPDKRQGSQLAAVVKGLHAELVHRANATDALSALQGRVPDLVLTTSLISPKDDSALAAHLRELGAAAAHVQTVTIPLLGTAAPQRAKGGMLAALRRQKAEAPMTDGCEPSVFAEQVRQYLATAEEQKLAAATRLAAEPEAVTEAPVVEAVETFKSFETFEALDAAPVDEAATTRIEEPAFAEWPETPAPVEAFEQLAAAPVEEVPVVEDTPVAEEEFAADEPAGLPLSQLLQLVSETAVAAEPPVAEATIEAVAEEIVEAVAEAPAPAGDFGDMYVDPMAAQALEELSRQAAPPSLADGIPSEVPVPVVEMRSFQSLDAIASELAAGPAHRHESLDDLASLFAATPAAPRAAAAPLEPSTISEFASLFAASAPAAAVDEPIEVPGIDPSLFAAAPAATASFQIERFEPVEEPVAPVGYEPVPVELLAEAAIPEPELVAAPETPVAIEPEPVVVPPMAVEEPIAIVEAAAAAELEPVVEPEPAVEDELIEFEPVVFEPASDEPVALAAAPEFDEEISLDVDAFVSAPAAPAKPEPFSFTLVEGFGDAWSDFDVPSVSAVAADLGVGEHLPLDPYAVKPAAAPAAPVSKEAIATTQAAPSLDAESLSIIGDAARKVSLDAIVIEEFERGMNAQRQKKVKKKAHAGATQVPPAAERPAKPAKRPVQDEWGMFDPEQCGFAALEDEEGAEARPTSGTRVRVISY